MKTVRCAIYTRKSNEEGLEKEFNTLEAQRESGENYIKSQVHQGWTIIEKHYDDGGFSGGNMNRPALQELLNDIKEGLVDMVVVYKIDRLSRSLLDFTKMIDVFDKANCSFISVTQNFNTADSMGRLMLNVLLSFAQFEREISGERIRDKIAATRKKGMWTGGRVALGYDVVNKKLVINEKEAKIVRYVFNRYLEMPSEDKIANELNEKGWKPKMVKGSKTSKIFYPKIISNMVKNPIYTGHIKFKDMLYSGEHQAIITDELFDAVSKIKQTKQTGGQPTIEYYDDSLLKDVLECGCCQSPMSVTTVKRGNKRYRYYLSHHAHRYGRSKCKLGPVSASELEMLIIHTIKPLFKNPSFIQELANETKVMDISCQEREAFDAMKSFEIIFSSLTLSGQREIINLLINKIVLFNTYALIYFKDGVLGLLPDSMKEKLELSSVALRIDYQLIKKRGKTTLVNDALKTKVDTDQTLIKAVLRGFQWTKQMEEDGISQKEIAKRENLNCGYVGKIMRFTILAPDIIQAIMEGRQPAYLTVNTFMRNVIPYRWEEQRKKFKFSPIK